MVKEFLYFFYTTLKTRPVLDVWACEQKTLDKTPRQTPKFLVGQIPPDKPPPLQNISDCLKNQSIGIHVCIYVCMYLCLYVNIYTQHMYACMHICMYVCMYYVCIYTGGSRTRQGGKFSSVYKIYWWLFCLFPLFNIMGPLSNLGRHVMLPFGSKGAKLV